MSYQLQERESLSSGIKRIVREQIDSAIEELSQVSDENRDKTIHSVPKKLKQIRAIVRLVRNELGKDVYKQENYCFRDVGRRLSALRDAQVLLNTLQQLKQNFAELIHQKAFVDLEQHLVQQHHLIKAQMFEQDDAVSEILTTLKQARERVNNWSLSSDRWSILSDGLQRIYQNGYQACQTFLEQQATVEDLHDWRKRVKDLWYQLKILRPIWFDVTEEWENQTHLLANYLGDDHDLAVLDCFISQQNEVLASAEKEVLKSLINSQRQQLQLSAQWLGQKIYVEQPKVFVKRLESYWQIWQQETEQLNIN